MRVAWVVVSVAAVASAAFYPCKGEKIRVRKPWSLLTTPEKELFVEALGEGMRRGFHHRFAEIHSEPESEQEAHGCMFIYWHRKFLLGYENMLRSLKPEYACITLPYWDYATLSSSYTSGSCRSVNQCSSDIIAYLGGNVDSTSTRSWDLINRDIMGGVGCVRGKPFNNFCQSTSAFESNQCMGCMPRANYDQARVPAEANIGQVFAQILGGGDSFSAASRSIQLGAHNTVHAALGGAMGTLKSPADVLFYAHHAQIDLMHRIYFKCVVADAAPPNRSKVLTDKEKQNANDRRIWTSCRRASNTVIQPKHWVRMFSGEAGSAPMDVNNPKNPLYEFFMALPREYYLYADGDDLGRFSYQYQYTGMLADMLLKCRNFVAPRRALLLDEEDGYTGNRSHYQQRCVKRPLLECEVKEKSFLDFMSTKAGELGWSHDTLVEQLEALVCIHQDECLGGCSDYTEEFKRVFHPRGPPRCKTITDRLKASDLFIKLPAWRQVMARYFPCPDDEEEAPYM
ncbi:hypothetical protein H310_11293 [Aphanomyces invadans]|uniref:Tyrosinase copper-binding domain-containing protein n=1 Tax=Aphanomyces invadans TaxID=157072 RepID=A0A024TN69_9STRA|nr:hypothetical protein H310_11293 [Aphanomyces invadans]ETV95419.1 hypothetical protein H310_11293 [Aphanomyces invadans]|eukprot:XP_008876120.1 hypothetical protein H310_11293 [Aphanomyces invadans]